MRRRALLTSLAAGTPFLAGCPVLGTSEDPATTATPTDRTTTDPGHSDDGTPTAEPDRPAVPDELTSVVELETAPRTYSLVRPRFRTVDDASVTLWFDRTATAEHPARLRGVFENANDFENTFRLKWIPFVGETHSRQPRGYDHEASLHAAPTENNDLATEVPEVRRNEDGFWQVADVGPWMRDRVRLEPGEAMELEYLLVGEPGSPGRPTGTYEFRGADRTVALHVWHSDRPGPDETSRFAGRSVPDVGESSTGWYHEADETTRGYVVPDSERVELDGAVSFEAVNHSAEAVGCGHWDLYKLVDGEWYHVGPVIHTDDCRQLAPGERMEWSLRAFNGEAVPCESCSGGGGCRGGFTRGFLGGGEYAVVAGYGAPHDQSAALLELVGDTVDVVASDDATVERDGETAVVTTDRYGDDEDPADGSFTLERTDRADERILPEQVMGPTGFPTRWGGLRNALAAMTGDVERVVVRTDVHAVDSAVGHDSDVRRFTLRGQAYEARRGGEKESS